jgi:hypothetical protein
MMALPAEDLIGIYSQTSPAKSILQSQEQFLTKPAWLPFSFHIPAIKQGPSRTPNGPSHQPHLEKLRQAETIHWASLFLHMWPRSLAELS